MNIGLTGGIGWGKSTVLRLLRDRGVHVFESDACVRALLVEDADLIDALESTFGAGIFDESRKIDRSKLASIVFGNPGELRKLEQLIHPKVRQKWESEVQARHPLLVVEIPLLFEKGLQTSFDLTICVATESKLQRIRLAQRGWSDHHITQRLEQQWSLEQKARLADIVIENNGSEQHLAEQLDYLLQYTLKAH